MASHTTKHHSVDEKKPPHDVESHRPSYEDDIFGSTSPGVQRIEAIASSFTRGNKILLFVGIFLFAFSISLDGLTTGAYVAQATSSFATHSLLATIGVVRGIIAAAAQPAYAKVSDVFGRLETLLFSIFFYVLGYIVVATSNGVRQYAGGVVLYQIGFTGIQLMETLIIADVTSLRNRLVFSFLPATPFIINCWAAGNVSASFIATGASWRWGVGMFIILTPVCAIPIVTAFIIAQRRAKRNINFASLKTARQIRGTVPFLKELFWRMDVPGIALMVTTLTLLFLPLTLAGQDVSGNNRWKSTDIICMLVFGGVALALFIIWELRAPFPAIPLRLFKDRTILGGIGIGFWLYVGYYIAFDFLYTVLTVAFDVSQVSAVRIPSMYSFAATLTGVACGLAVRYVRRLKPFIVAGTCIYTLALGMMIRFRGHGDTAGLIGSIVVLGIAGGLFPYGTQVALQAAVKHEHMALITATYFCVYQIGYAVGAAISGAVWTQRLPAKLLQYTSNATLAQEIYSSPFAFELQYPVGTPERTAAQLAYNDVQKYMAIIATVLMVFLISSALIMKNPRLPDEQSFKNPEAAKDTIGSEVSQEKRQK